MMKDGSFLRGRANESSHFFADIHVLVCIGCGENMNNDGIYNGTTKPTVPLKGLSFARKMSQTASRFSAFAPRPYTVSTREGTPSAAPVGKATSPPS